MNVGNKKYTKVIYINAITPVIIFCNDCNKEFNQKPHDHLGGHGCSACKHLISTPEIKWLDSLNISKEYRHKTIYVNKKRFNLDAYDPINKIIWEFYGDYWHGNPNNLKLNQNKIHPLKKISFNQCYLNTLNREKFLKDGGYTVISIWELDFNDQGKNA